jgi:hypothetical protein
MLILLAVLQVVPWLAIGGLVVGPRLRQDAHKLLPLVVGEKGERPVADGKLGAWGQLEYTNFDIELPDEFVFLPPADQPAVRWFFTGYSKDQVVEFLTSAGVAPSQLETLLQKGVWATSAKGTALSPDDDFILGLSAAARSKIYLLLADFPENVRQIDPVWFRPGAIDQRMEGSGLAESSIRLFKSLLYPQGSSMLLFADYEPMMRKLPDDEQRRCFVKAIHCKPAVLARLQIDANANVEGLCNYWGVGGRRKDLLPLLDAMRRLNGGWEQINVVFLLPRFMRDRLYNHPYPAASADEPKEDCFWSALNAFNDQPDDRFNDMQYVQQVLARDYYTILDPSQLGDLIFLVTREGMAVHAAVYVADDIVFTKNGDHHTQPWILMHMQDMVDTYAVRYPKSAPMRPLYYRKKAL